MLARSRPEAMMEDMLAPEVTAPAESEAAKAGEEQPDSMAGFDSEQGLRALRLSMVPPFLDWGPSELCRPVLSSVDIVNLSPDTDVTIKSVSTDDNQFFYGSDDEFAPVTVEPQKNVSVPFLFVPQALGVVHSSVYVSTSAGDFTYKFQATGIANAHGIEPVHANLAPGVTLKRRFPIHNPGSESIRVLEVYTAEDAFQLQLPAGDGEEPSEDKHPAKLWKIEPGQRKTVIQLTFDTPEPTRVAGYIHIRTDKDTFVIAVDVAVVAGEIVPSPAELAFGTLTSIPGKSSMTVKLLNSHKTDIRVLGMSDSDPAASGAQLGFEMLPFGSGDGVIAAGTEVEAAVVSFEAM